ncbi:MAG: AraC family transcriptional regulator [Lachnospiraceae bacterium]|nr:AraC family transcriptional regulator [Lachnospiraceae bacterium]
MTFNTFQIDIPSDEGMQCGKMIWKTLSENLYLGYMDIHSANLPESIFASDLFREPEETVLKINYCSKGKCEVRLKSGDSTFVAGGELSIDYGNTGNNQNAFYYPTTEYGGVELLYYKSDEYGDKLPLFKGENLFDNLIEKFIDRDVPYITMCDTRIRRAMEDLREDLLDAASIDIHNRNDDLIEADIIRLLLLLQNIDFSEEKRRIYCTPSQVEIVKESMKIISSNLNKRYSAAELAARFGVSETSLKNYFKAVYGKGYSDIITDLRMTKSAKLILENDKKMGEIAMSVGYQNQSKFSEAFRKYHGMLPMEYKRKAFPKK